MQISLTTQNISRYNYLIVNIILKYVRPDNTFCFQVCMALSSLYHTFSCRSERDCYTFLSYDLFGIALSLLAIYTSGIYYAFWCNEVYFNKHIVLFLLIYFLGC